MPTIRFKFCCIVFVALFFVAVLCVAITFCSITYFRIKLQFFIFLRQIDHHRIDLLRGGVEQLQKFADIQPIALLLLVYPMALPTEKIDYFYEKWKKWEIERNLVKCKRSKRMPTQKDAYAHTHAKVLKLILYFKTLELKGQIGIIFRHF